MPAIGGLAFFDADSGASGFVHPASVSTARIALKLTKAALPMIPSHPFNVTMGCFAMFLWDSAWRMAREIGRFALAMAAADADTNTGGSLICA